MTRRTPILQKRCDWVGLLDAAYDPRADDEGWAAQLLEVAGACFSQRDCLGVIAIEHDDECASGRVLLQVGTGPLAAPVPISVSAAGPEVVRGLFYPPAMVTTHSELEPALSSTARLYLQGMRRLTQSDEVCGVVVHPEPGVAVALSCTLPGVTRPDKRERHFLSQFGLHLAAAFRLRRRPEVVRAVLSLDGELIDGESSEAPVASRALEATRATVRRGLSLETWTALLAGRYSLVARRYGGQRRYLVLENAMSSQTMRALTAREVEILHVAASGVSTKLIAYGMGIGHSAVSEALGRAASKLGLSSRIELVRLAATLCGDPRARALPATLTAAESAILAMLREGRSNRQIAQLRSRSVRTIANQVASLLRKTSAGSRRELVTR